MGSKQLAVGFGGQQQQHFRLIPCSIVATILYVFFMTLPETQAGSNTTITTKPPGSNGQILENQTSDSFVEPAADQTKEDSIESIESINHIQEIDINSIDDGLLTADRAERHHYDRQQQQQLVEQKQVSITEKPALINQSELASADTTKPELRNQQDQQMEQIIIDHRPLEQQQQGNFVHHQELQMDSELPPTSQAPQLPATPINRAASESNLHPTFTSSNAPAPSSATKVRYNQAETLSTQTPAPGSPTTSWRSSPVQFNYSPQQQLQQRLARNQFSQSSSQAQSQPTTNQQSAMPAATSSFGPIVSSSSNQVVTVQQQYPTSINSIINEQQPQQPVQFSGTLSQPTTQQQVGIPAAGNQIGTSQQQSSQQPQMVTLANGQPASVLLVGQSGTLNGSGGSGGRRISIAGWLRGISNMLANMFNRRDHGVQLNGQPSNPNGHWIQLGPNAPHWLSQAQTLLHNQQQQYQQQLGAASSNRYATFVQAPQQPQQQPQTMTITMQPATILTSNNNKKQQQAATTSPFATVGGGDMQASSSSPTYTLTQVPMQQPQQQQLAIAQYNQQPVISPPPQQPLANQQQQQQVIIGGLSGAVQSQDPGTQTVTARQAGSQQVEYQHWQQLNNKQASSTTQPSALGAQQNQLQQQQNQHSLQAQNEDNYQQQYHQSKAWSTPVVSYQQQQQQVAPSSALQIQTRHINTSPTLVVSNSNLPLAHYSRFAASPSD